MKKLIVFCMFLMCSEALAGPEEKINQALYKSYVAAIKNSIGTRAFRQLYMYDKDADRVVEVLQNGNLSCAYFVSSTLHHFGLLDNFRVNVEETATAMKAQGWQTIKKPVPGSVIVWNKMYFKKSKKRHGHIGFFVGPHRAISTSSHLGYPVIHNLRPNGRKIIEILWHPRLSPQSTNP
jgi:hypothetical protein